MIDGGWDVVNSLTRSPKQLMPRSTVVVDENGPEVEGA